ncbi:glycosyl hydrolase family 85-domain-containing protein [Cristinia sonorae]|uniref:Glycosyl hydrolase family 85-domain-containing protein n=1 Tax=Cristinia sonorae TaxID=1940300 RepID=A0A8K0UVU0_9AGAR|nr:glycosyl hydrolase family 85-domain-containing protein [Cristinia sonorae]
MPLHGTNHSKLVLDDKPYFDSLAELDAWGDNIPPSLSGTLRYHARSQSTSTQGRLLLCHDYKGGYIESPSHRSYTFNFWSHCDTFIYFSHHRVTVPPSGWITAAHRQGVKMLGTLIFEHDTSEEDCLRLLIGRLPKSKSGPLQTPEQMTIPISPHYARLLASLAKQRGFDGYLLNFEYPLRGAVEQTRALSLWISLLEHELREQVGPHSEVIWYDSVIVDGTVRWQDRLSSVNVPFFVPSTGFFTNYTWRPNYPTLTAQYFLTLEPQHLERPRPKSLRDIYVGVDVWGRGSHGGGGFGAYKAISHIDPEFLGLSVALFGQAWSWETEEGKEGFSWETWWAHERKLWVGPMNPTEGVRIPEPPEDEGCDHIPYKPITSFFALKPPPDPLTLTFHTSFCPGVGKEWFVEGVKVLGSTKDGWTDLNKNTTIGDLAWPYPAISSELGEWEGSPPVVLPTLDMHDAWVGGSSLRLDVNLPIDPSSEASFRCIWIPIQSLSMASQQSYDIKLVYKVVSGSGTEVDLGPSLRSLDNTNDPLEIDIVILPIDEILATREGWTTTSIRISVKSQLSSHTLAVGLVVGIAQEEPTTQDNNTLSIFLGQLSAFPSPSDVRTSIPEPQVLWADYQKPETGDKVGVLTWEVAQSLPSITALSIRSVEDPQPAWTIDTHPRSFLYFNIYAEAGVGDAKRYSFIGTSGSDGRGNRFLVDPACMPSELSGCKQLRFTVQGVTDRGEVLGRERCVYVDVVVDERA